jgi:hypothetical protein
MRVMFLRQMTRRAVAGAAANVAIVATLVAVPAVELAQATPVLDPYTISQVVDSNADPDIVETTLVADETTVDVGLDRMARAMTFNGTIPGPEFRLKVNDTVINRPGWASTSRSTCCPMIRTPTAATHSRFSL